MLYLFGAIGLFVVADLTRGYLKAVDKKSYLIKSLTGIFIVVLLLFLYPRQKRLKAKI